MEAREIGFMLLMQEWCDYLFPLGKGDANLSEELDGLDAAEAL